jgi:hypothetical protein
MQYRLAMTTSNPLLCYQCTNETIRKVDHFGDKEKHPRSNDKGNTESQIVVNQIIVNITLKKVSDFLSKRS